MLNTLLKMLKLSHEFLADFLNFKLQNLSVKNFNPCLNFQLTPKLTLQAFSKFKFSIATIRRHDGSSQQSANGSTFKNARDLLKNPTISRFKPMFTRDSIGEWITTENFYNFVKSFSKNLHNNIFSHLVCVFLLCHAENSISSIFCVD